MSVRGIEGHPGFPGAPRALGGMLGNDRIPFCGAGAVER
jgi:hypothetical protein